MQSSNIKILNSAGIAPTLGTFNVTMSFSILIPKPDIKSNLLKFRFIFPPAQMLLENGDPRVFYSLRLDDNGGL